jgi:D-arginine dehydrogenase
MIYDVAIIGGGIAGISAAANLAPLGSVVLLEAEPILGYHATGRSAALYTECYGPGVIPRLTMASRRFFTEGAKVFGTPRGVMFVGTHAQAGVTANLHTTYSGMVPDLERISKAEIRDICPAIDTSVITHGLLEPRAMDLDVSSIEQAFRRKAIDHGTNIIVDARVTDLRRSAQWQIRSRAGDISARVIVNAAGAWADEVALLAGITPLGLRPLKRSAFLTNPPFDPRPWPMIVDVEEQWYFKPEGQNLLGSAASELLSPPMDARADEEDVARGIERINAVTSLGIRTVTTAWAGLRTFTTDRTPAVGFEPDDPTFFWLVGQGGYGIKTSPAMGQLTAGLISHGMVPDGLRQFGITAGDLDPARFRPQQRPFLPAI